MNRIERAVVNNGDELFVYVRETNGMCYAVPISDASGEVAVMEVKYPKTKKKTGYYAVCFSKSKIFFFIKKEKKAEKSWIS